MGFFAKITDKARANYKGLRRHLTEKKGMTPTQVNRFIRKITYDKKKGK